MNRRDAFKAMVAGAAALLGLKGLLAREPRFIGAGTLEVTEAEAASGYVMGETAHWPEHRQWETIKQFHAVADRNSKAVDRLMERVDRGEAVNARVAAVKIDGEWVDATDWTPEKVRAICQPRPLKRRHV